MSSRSPPPVAALNASYSPVSNYPRRIWTALGHPAGTPTTWIAPAGCVPPARCFLNDQTAFGGAFKLGTEPSLTNNKGVVRGRTRAASSRPTSTPNSGHALPRQCRRPLREDRADAVGLHLCRRPAVPIVADREYDDTLPSMNLVLEPRENLLLRFGAAKVMARPDLGSLTPGAAFSVSGAGRSGQRRQPEPGPVSAPPPTTSRSNGTSPSPALLSVALFRKDIDSFVQNAADQPPPSPATLRPARQRRRRRLRHDHRLQPFTTSGPSPPRPTRPAARWKGYRDQLPAAVQLPAGPPVQHRRAAELHLGQLVDRTI
jgi:iron complex outermembrane receptor protein